MDYVRNFIIFLVCLVALYFLTAIADDIRYGVAASFEELGQQDRAISSYESIIKDFYPTIEKCRKDLLRLDPVRFKHFKETGKSSKRKVNVDI